MDGRLCAATGGQFSGPNAKISAGYITSCYNMQVMFQTINGCQGGNPGWALKQVKKTYFGGGSPSENCVPYFGSGNSLQHFDSKGNMEAPTCPTGCSGNYNRDLTQDLFYTLG